ncbi:MAG: hypothetical protein DRJ41_04445, partial [Thermoprotei archaeon]
MTSEINIRNHVFISIGGKVEVFTEREMENLERVSNAYKMLVKKDIPFTAYVEVVNPETAPTIVILTTPENVLTLRKPLAELGLNLPTVTLGEFTLGTLNGVPIRLKVFKPKVRVKLAKGMMLGWGTAAAYIGAMVAPYVFEWIMNNLTKAQYSAPKVEDPPEIDTAVKTIGSLLDSIERRIPEPIRHRSVLTLSERLNLTPFLSFIRSTHDLSLRYMVKSSERISRHMREWVKLVKEGSSFLTPQEMENELKKEAREVEDATFTLLTSTMILGKIASELARAEETKRRYLALPLSFVYTTMSQSQQSQTQQSIQETIERMRRQHEEGMRRLREMEARFEARRRYGTVVVRVDFTRTLPDLASSSVQTMESGMRRLGDAIRADSSIVNQATSQASNPVA